MRGDSNSWFIEVHLLSQGASSIVEGVFSPCFPSFEADSSGAEVPFCRSIASIFIAEFRILIAAFVSRQISIPQLEHE